MRRLTAASPHKSTGPAGAPGQPIDSLPIDAVAAEIARSLEGRAGLVLQAPPGAGKTTRLPLLLRRAGWLGDRRLILVEPRRMAARAAARRMAASLGEEAGGLIGYRVRQESRIGPATRIEAVTHGTFIRMIQGDPSLDGIGAVLFDEFHERSLDSDLGLALCLEAQKGLRPDLRLIVMSATLDGGPIASLLGDVPVVTTERRAFPVALRWLDKPPRDRLAPAVASAVRQAVAAEAGDVLVFLPGAREIRQVHDLLDASLDPGIDLAILHGDLPPEAQDAALAETARRRIVLATSIAETSLTIPGVRIVVDSGYRRTPRFDPSSGLSRLETVAISQAAADQRAGRAGRTAPGHCWRLWGENEHRALVPFDPPEILDADLAPLALELALWGVAEARALDWLTPPPEAAMAQAQGLLRELGALDAAGRATPHGKRLGRFGTHPRLAHMMVAGAALGLAGPAAALAALLGERDLLRGPASRDPDLRSRLDLLAGRDGGTAAAGAVDRGALARMRQDAGSWRRQLDRADGAQRGVGGVTSGAAEEAGLLLALAYPDRVAQRRSDAPGEFLMANGRGAWIDMAEPLAAAEFLGVAVLDGDRRRARIRLAAPLDPATIETLFADRIEEADEIGWDSRAEAVFARKRRRLGALILDERRQESPDAEAVAAAMLAGLRELGIAALPWTPKLRNWQARIAFLRRVEGAEAWPDAGDAALAATMPAWLAPFLGGLRRRADLDRLDLAAALDALLSPLQRRRLASAAPTHLTVPTGSVLPLDYASGEEPVLAVRLQEMFGARDTPRLAEGRVPVTLHLLSPGHRPVQVTRDLAGFWAGSYRQVRAELRGRYPKHAWPEDPLAAAPLRGPKRRGVHEG